MKEIGEGLMLALGMFGFFGIVMMIMDIKDMINNKAEEVKEAERKEELERLWREARQLERSLKKGEREFIEIRKNCGAYYNDKSIIGVRLYVSVLNNLYKLDWLRKEN